MQKVLIGVMIGLIMAAFVYCCFFIIHSQPVSSDTGAVVVQSKVVKAPVALQRLSPESGAKPSSSNEDGVTSNEDKLLKLKLKPTFDVK